MNKRLTKLAAVMLALSAVEPAGEAIAREDEVLLGIPVSVLGGKTKLWTREPVAVKIAIGTSGDLVVNDMGEWRSQGFPPLVRLKVTGIRTLDHETRMELEGVEDGRLRLHVTLPGQVREVPHEAFPARGRRDAYIQDASRGLMPRVFAGTPLADLAEETRRDLLSAGLEARAMKMEVVTGPGPTHLRIDLGAEDVVYNDQKVEPGARVVRVVVNRFLPVLSRVAGLLKDVATGVQIEMDVAHKKFDDSEAAVVEDHLVTYTPAHDLGRFGKAEITAQEVIDRSQVTVNGRRVKPLLACDCAPARKE